MVDSVKLDSGILDGEYQNKNHFGIETYLRNHQVRVIDATRSDPKYQQLNTINREKRAENLTLYLL